MPIKTCNMCGNGTYRVRGWWATNEVTYICQNCNSDETLCICPQLDGVSPGVKQE